MMIVIRGKCNFRMENY